MTTRREVRNELERLQAVLDVYGGDRDRWPASERLELARLVASDVEAERMVREARALDRLLDQAPVLGSERLQMLTQRVVAAAEAEGRWTGEGAVTAVAATDPVTPPTAVKEPRMIRPQPMPAPRGHMQSAMLLAASLVMGILAGATVLSGELPGAAVSGDDIGVQQLVMGDDDTVDVIEEDLL